MNYEFVFTNKNIVYCSRLVRRQAIAYTSCLHRMAKRGYQMTENSNARLESYSRIREHYLIGIMSGTSLDGVDAVLVKTTNLSGGELEKVELLGEASLPYSDEIKKILLKLCSISGAKIDDLVYADFGLSEWYAAVVSDLLGAAKFPASDVSAICLHGQTVWHAPARRPFPAPRGGTFAINGTLQIGSAPALRELTGIPVISDFRSRDMAAGGEGAPLAPYVDALLFGHPGRGRIVQNIGGIGNATVVPAGSRREGVFAFDTGPGNMIMDELVRRETSGKEHYDKGGARAGLGKADLGFVEELMSDPYFVKAPPKSTGREVYGADFVDGFAARAKMRGLSAADAIATATAFTAESIVASYRDFIFGVTDISDVVVGGGGALNATLMAMIRARLPEGVSLLTTADLGIPEQAREAIAFAVLGHEALMGRPGNLHEVTGASRDVILGTITL